ncbi:MAG: CIA30 family protein [bacterium]|nr:CIA30 family protein [bacterium]
MITLNLDTKTIDFGEKKTNSWFSLNDTVMGGKSKGNTRYKEDVLLFTGDVSFENNGGFASVRSENMVLDLSDYEQVSIRYRCKNQSLSLNFNYYNQWYLPNYKLVLPESNMEWKEISVYLDELKEYQIGRPTGNYISKDRLQRIIRLAFMTYDKQEGSFEAEIDYIKFK